MNRVSDLFCAMFNQHSLLVRIKLENKNINFVFQLKKFIWNNLETKILIHTEAIQYTLKHSHKHRHPDTFSRGSLGSLRSKFHIYKFRLTLLSDLGPGTGPGNE